MIEFNEYRRNPFAPTPFVNKLCGIYRVNPHIIKCTLAFGLHAGPEMVKPSKWQVSFQEIRRGTFADEGGRLLRAH
jgi:hypothetical protein